MPVGVDPRLSACFSRPPAEITGDGWEWVQLTAEQQLWRQGEAADSVAWVASGRLRIDADGVTQGMVGAGELLGEASAFVPNEERSADVIAVEPTGLWLLRRARLAHLRVNNVAFYDMILQAAIETVAQRINENDQKISKQMPAWQRPSIWSRVRHSFERPDEPPPVMKAISALPNLPPKGVLTNDLAAIAEPRWLKTGHTLCVQGEPAQSMYIVAHGTLIVKLSEEGKGKGKGDVELARIGPGALLGTAALLRECPRTASLVAAEPTWVYEMTREKVSTLSAGAWRILCESLLVVMREQLIRTHEH